MLIFDCLCSSGVVRGGSGGDSRVGTHVEPDASHSQGSVSQLGSANEGDDAEEGDAEDAIEDESANEGL